MIDLANHPANIAQRLVLALVLAAPVRVRVLKLLPQTDEKPNNQRKKESYECPGTSVIVLKAGRGQDSCSFSGRFS